MQNNYWIIRVKTKHRHARFVALKNPNTLETCKSSDARRYEYAPVTEGRKLRLQKSIQEIALTRIEDGEMKEDWLWQRN